MIGNYTELLYRIAVPAFSTGLYYSVWATSHWLIVCCMVKRDKPTAVLFLYYETNLKDAALNLGYTAYSCPFPVLRDKPQRCCFEPWIYPGSVCQCQWLWDLNDTGSHYQFPKCLSPGLLLSLNATNLEKGKIKQFLIKIVIVFPLICRFKHLGCQLNSAAPIACWSPLSKKWLH